MIVGAGLVGSAMACALAADKHGASLRIVVVEAGEEPRTFSGAEFDPRVVALTHASQTLLDSVGAWSRILQQRACAYTDMDVWDAEGTGHIHFDAHEVQQPCLGHIVENSVATTALLQCLHEYSNIELLRRARVKVLHRDESSGQPQLLLDDGRKITASLLIAADGAHSKIRELANMPTREWDYHHDAIVTTVATERSHQFTAWQRFLPSGPLAFLPLQGEQFEVHSRVSSIHHSSIVWSLPPERARELMSLDDDNFKQELGRAFELRLGEVTQVAKRFSFPLRQRHAVDYIQPGIVLIGDAAHTIHPLAGQGVNLGFLDVSALRDEILRACRRQVPLSDLSILKRYQRNRKSHNLAMMSMMEGFKRLFGADNLPVRWLRNEGMRQLQGVPLLKDLVVKQAMGL